MLVHCPICSEILLPSDVLMTTPCGHIFHNSCLSRWIGNNTTCPQCRSPANSATIHRVFLPEVNFQDNDSLIERLNDINKQKHECERKLKEHEQKDKAKDIELRRYKKDYHRVLRRNLRKKGIDNIPTRHHKRSTANIQEAQPQARSTKNHPSSSLTTQQKKTRRNPTRAQRSKLYFQRKRMEHRNNNGPSGSAELETSNRVSIELTDAISVSSDD